MTKEKNINYSEVHLQENLSITLVRRHVLVRFSNVSHVVNRVDNRRNGPVNKMSAVFVPELGYCLSVANLAKKKKKTLDS